MPYAITGLLSQMEDVKRRMQGPLAPPSDAFQLPQQGGPPQGAPPPPQALPVAEPPSPPPPVAKGRGGLLSANVPAEYGQMFSPEELAQAKPGKIQSLLGRIIGESPTGIMRSNLDEMAKRKVGVGKYQDEQTTREQAATLKQQMDGLRREAAANGMGFPEFAQRLAMIRPELSAQLAGMVNAMEPPATKAEPPIPNLSWVSDGKGGYKQLGSAAPEKVRRQLVQIPQPDGTVKYKWLAEGEEADGVRPDSRARATVTSTYKTKKRTLDDLKDAIATYRTRLTDSGIEVQPGEKKSLLTGAYANLKLLAKEAANLGALTGPDVVILEELFNDPASLKSAALNVLQGGQRAKGLLSQLDQYESIVKGNRTRLDEAYPEQAAEMGDKKKQLPPADSAKSKSDPKFRAWAIANGYEVP